MIAESYLVLHGIENHRPPEHWQFWIAGRMRDRGHQVLYPALPDADTPSYERWEAALAEDLGRMDGSQRTVICHSLACLLWFGAASTVVAPGAVDRLLLVAPPASECVPEAGASFRLDSLDANAIRASAKTEVRIACSDADPYNPDGAGSMYGVPLACPVDVIVGGGHITPDTGYGRWPSLEAWCTGAAEGPVADGCD